MDKFCKVCGEILIDGEGGADEVCFLCDRAEKELEEEPEDNDQYLG